MSISQTVFLKRHNLILWILAARPKTLYAGIAPVILGSALAFQVGKFQIIPAILCLLFSLLVQIGCNYANDYYDYVKGVDNEERIGFKRMVSSGQIAPKAMKRATFLVLTIAFFVGCGLIHYGGVKVIPIGVICIICAVLYTGGPYPLGYYGLGDIFVFIFYGLVAVMVTFYVQTNFFSLASLCVAIGCGCLAANIRLVNDVRDKDTDAKAGKKTSVVRFGKTFCYIQYILSVIIGCCVVPLLLVLGLGFNLWILMPMLLVIIYIRLIVALIKAKNGNNYNHILIQSAKMLFLYALMLSGMLLLNK